MTHSVTLQMTRGHIALGGGGLALFGTGCMWTWPSAISGVAASLSDPTPLDPTLYMDDSGYRGTLGGCVATTLGSVLHELGHTFDLGHTEDGIMARGFDDLDSLLTIISERGGSRSGESLSRQLRPCGQGNLSRGPSPTLTGHSVQSPRFTTIRRSDSVTKYLEEYSEKRLERSLEEERGEGGCYWSRSCAVILSHQPWIRSEEISGCDGDILMSSREVQSCCTIAVVELRGRRSVVRHSWLPEVSYRCLQLEEEVMDQVTTSPNHSWELVTMATCGRLRKMNLIQ